MHISSGRVVYLRSVQPAQYETKKAEVELTFALAEGEELGNTLGYVSSLAMARAHQMIGITAPDVVKEQTAADTAGKAIVARAAKAAAEKKAATEKGAENTTVSDAVFGEKVANKPAAEEDVPGFLKRDAENKLPADPLLAELVGTQPDLTDQEFSAQVVAIVAKIGAAGPNAVREKLNKFIPEGKPRQISAVPENQRRTFLAEIQTLVGK
jgi:hypothetical protein